MTTTFAGNSTLRESYVLKGGSKITGQISMGGFVNGGEVSADSGVYVSLYGLRGRQFAPIGEAEVTKAVVTPGDRVYAFEIPVPDALDGVAVSGLSADIGVRNLTVLQNGFLDGQGGSFFRLPYLEPLS